MMSELIDTKGIADRYAFSQRYVTDRLTKRAGFPEPVVDVSQKARRWDLQEVDAFVNPRRRHKRAAMSSADSR